MRLGLSQSDFAALAGATKGAQQKWERDASTPNGAALVAFAGAGADVPFILFGQRQSDRRADTLQNIAEQIKEYRRELVDPEKPSSDVATRNGLQSIIWYDAKLLTPEMREEAEQLLEIAQDDAKLHEFRAGEAVALRHRKEQMRRRVASALEGIEPPPGETVSYLLLQLAVDHGVPARALGDLWEQIQADATDRREA